MPGGNEHSMKTSFAMCYLFSVTACTIFSLIPAQIQVVRMRPFTVRA